MNALPVIQEPTELAVSYWCPQSLAGEKEDCSVLGREGGDAVEVNLIVEARLVRRTIDIENSNVLGGRLP